MNYYCKDISITILNIIWRVYQSKLRFVFAFMQSRHGISCRRFFLILLPKNCEGHHNFLIVTVNTASSAAKKEEL